MASLSCTPSLARSASLHLGRRRIMQSFSRDYYCSFSSSPIASTSKLMLPSRATPSAPTLLRPKVPVNLKYRNTRGMVTISRQPETPEEPEVFSGGEPPSIIVTDRAIQHLAKVAKKESKTGLALRITVEPGGCHGYQYKMELTEEVEDDDFRFSSGDTVHLLVDSTSLRLIKGSTIDYVTELIGSQFAILNNPQAKGAGCGCGVSWEPNF